MFYHILMFSYTPIDDTAIDIVRYSKSNSNVIGQKAEDWFIEMYNVLEPHRLLVRANGITQEVFESKSSSTQIEL